MAICYASVCLSSPQTLNHAIPSYHPAHRVYALELWQQPQIHPPQAARTPAEIRSPHQSAQQRALEPDNCRTAQAPTTSRGPAVVGNGRLPAHRLIHPLKGCQIRHYTRQELDGGGTAPCQPREERLGQDGSGGKFKHQLDGLPRSEGRRDGQVLPCLAEAAGMSEALQSRPLARHHGKRLPETADPIVAEIADEETYQDECARTWRKVFCKDKNQGSEPQAADLEKVLKFERRVRA